MSEDSSDDQPYFVRYGEAKWYGNKAAFPVRRRPDVDLFGIETVNTIVKKTYRNANVDILELQSELRELSKAFIMAALTTPIGLSDGPGNIPHDKRMRWLMTHILNPVRTLINALDLENEHQIAEWPHDIPGKPPSRKILMKQLRLLEVRIDGLYANFEDRITDRCVFLTEFRVELADRLRDIFIKYFPELEAERSSYDKTSAPKSPYVTFMRLCAEEMFPNDKIIADGVLDKLIPKKNR